MSGTWSSVPGRQPGGELHGDERNRGCAAARPQPLGAATVTVNLIAPATVYADRRTNLDFRVAKILRYGRTRTQIGLDVYNLTNTDVVTTFNQTFAPTRRVADADCDSAGALRQDQRAVRLLDCRFVRQTAGFPRGPAVFFGPDSPRATSRFWLEKPFLDVPSK